MTRITSAQVAESNRVYDILASIPAEKKFILALLAGAFIDGMNAQERLMVNSPQSADRPGA